MRAYLAAAAAAATLIAIAPAAASAAAHPASHRVEWRRSGLCLTPAGGATSAGTPVVLASCSHAATWTLSGSRVTLAGTGEMLLMDVRKGGVTVLGTRPRAWRTWRWRPARRVLEEVWLSHDYQPHRLFGLAWRRGTAAGRQAWVAECGHAAGARWTLLAP